MYSDYGITVNSKDWWSFDNDATKNLEIFGVDNSSLSHVDDPQNHFLTLGLSPTFGINESFGSPEKKPSLNFTKTNTKLCLSLHYNDDISATKSREVSLNGNMYDLSVECHSIDKSDILSNHRYLMIKNNIN